MAVKNVSRVQLDDFVAQVRPDPSDRQPLTILTGFVGRGDGDGRIRVYADPSLSWWYELDEADVVHSRPLDQSPLGGSHLWVRSEAKMTTGTAQAAGEVQAVAAHRAAGGQFNPYLAGVPVTDPSICIDPSTNCPPFTKPPVCIDPVAGWRAAYDPRARSSGVPATDPSICIDPSTNCPPFTKPPICIDPVAAWGGAYGPRVNPAGSVPISDPSICIDTNPPGCVPITDPSICVSRWTRWGNYWVWR